MIYNINFNINYVYYYGLLFKLNYNFVYEGFDCLWLCNMGDFDLVYIFDYSYNWVMLCGDECIEFDIRELINFCVYYNFFMDVIVVLVFLLV